MPIVTLTTDFGESDHFVGVMKGMVLSLAPRATLVDISHQIAPYSVTEGAFVISEAYRYFPKGTIHVVVVDPGVGTARRPLLVQAAGQYFIGPDNGVLAMVYLNQRARVRELSNKKYFRQEISQTFHGRDVFAPAAAHLAAGARVSLAGPLIGDGLRLSSGVPVRTGRRFWTGEVAHVDRFGNLITNLAAAEFLPMVEKGLALKIGLIAVTRLVRSYAEAPAGEATLIEGSSGNLEVALNQESAARKLGVGLGAPVELEVW